MKTKRTLSLILTLLMVLAMLAGCGGDTASSGTDSSENPDAAATTDDGYPNRTISLVVPYDAGGATDLIARAMQPKMEEYLGATFAVQNMSGGNTAVGNQFVLDADP